MYKYQDSKIRIYSNNTQQSTSLLNLSHFLKKQVKGKQLTWNLQVNASAVTVKLIWIKADKSIATSGEVAS